MGLTKRIIITVLTCFALTAVSQPTSQQEQWEWYLDEVVNDVFVGRNDFEYYYMPSASDMESQRNKGEVTYFLNSPEGLNSSKVRNMIDRLMASYDDIKAVSDWQTTSSIYWKEFRFEKNKFRFNVKRKALDDGTYYVSVTETANYYKSLGKKKNSDGEKVKKNDKRKASGSSTRSRKKAKKENLDEEPVEEVEDSNPKAEIADVDADRHEVLTPKERSRAARQREEAQKQEKRAALKREQEQKKAEAKAQKEAEKQRKAEEKKQRQEEERLKKEEKKRQQEQERLERKQAQREQEEAKAKASKPQPVESRYHYSDIALWLSEKYDFTQTACDESSCTMYSTAVKDVEMAKLAIKNALKGSNARMSVPWRLNNTTGEIETGYSVDDHVLVFAIGKNEDGQVTITVTEVSNEQFELFKQSLNN